MDANLSRTKSAMTVLVGVAALIGVGLPNAAQLNQTATLEVWTLPDADSGPEGIDYDPVDGKIYATEFRRNQIAVLDPTTNEIVEWAVNNGPNGIKVVRGSGSSLVLEPPTVYFSESLSLGFIGMLDPNSGGYVETPTLGASVFPDSIDLDLSGNVPAVYYTQRRGNAVGVFDTSNATLSHIVPPHATRVAPAVTTVNEISSTLTPNTTPGNPRLVPAITSLGASGGTPMVEWDVGGLLLNGGLVEDVLVQNDGPTQVWLALSNESILPLLDPSSSTALLYDLPRGSGATSLAIDGFGNVWYADSFNDRIGKLTPSTQDVTEWSLQPGSQPLSITVDPDSGIVWFVEREADRLASFEPATNRLYEYQLPFNSRPVDLVQNGPNEVMFVTERGNFIGRLTLTALGTPPQASSTTTALTGLQLAQNAQQTAATLTVSFNYDGQQGLPVSVGASPSQGGVTVDGFTWIPGHASAVGAGVDTVQILYKQQSCIATDGLKVFMYPSDLGSNFFEQMVSVNLTWGCN